jgi:SAM-dependent methyltransferase
MGQLSEAKLATAEVFGRAAATYDSVIPFFRTFAADLVDAASIVPGERVLDLACGRGAGLDAARAKGAQVLGVDLSAEMVAELGDAARVMDAEALDLPDESFDVVLCSFGVFFFPDPRRALQEALRVLVPGGRFAATTFAGGMGGYPWFGEVARALGPAQPAPPPSPVLVAEGLQIELAAAGFVHPVTTRVEERFVFPDVGAYESWVWSHGGRRLLEGLDDAGVAEHRRLAAERLQDHAVDGGYELVQAVDLTVARREAAG